MQATVEVFGKFRVRLYALEHKIVNLSWLRLVHGD